MIGLILRRWLAPLRREAPHYFDGELAAATIDAVAADWPGNEKAPREVRGAVSVSTGL